LADDVDFRALAERFAVSGGDIKNAVLKAAQTAAAEEGEDGAKRITQAHLVAGMEQVKNARHVMSQNLLSENGGLPEAESLLAPLATRLEKLEADTNLCRAELGVMGTSVELLGDQTIRDTSDLREQLARETTALGDQVARETATLHERL